MKRCRLYSLCREIDNVFGALRTCFDHVLSKFSGFSWERILFLKSASVNMVMQRQVQIGDTSIVFFYESARECWGFKKLHFAWDSEDTFYGFWLTLRKRWRRICSVEWRSHGRHSPRLACLLALFTVARIACLLRFCVALEESFRLCRLKNHENSKEGGGSH